MNSSTAFSLVDERITFEALSADFNYELLELAVRYARRVNFSYKKPNGVVSSRGVTPFEILTSNAGDEVVYAKDDDGEIRGFRLDRILGYVHV